MTEPAFNQEWYQQHCLVLLKELRRPVKPEVLYSLQLAEVGLEALGTDSAGDLLLDLPAIEKDPEWAQRLMADIALEGLSPEAVARNLAIEAAVRHKWGEAEEF